MKAIVAVDFNWAIAKNGKLLFKIKEDMRRFQCITMNRVVVMGRKTLESLPNQKPLPSRTNIVLSRDKDYSVRGATVVHSLDELREELKQYDSEDVYVIGGEDLYAQLLDECTDVLVTFVHKEYDGDQFFPNLFEREDEWEEYGDTIGKAEYDLAADCYYEYILFTNKKLYNE